MNVVADNEPVNITLNSTGTTDAVNIGSTGGAGTMAGILGAINIIDNPGFYTLTFHDENDTTGHTWTLNNDDTDGAVWVGDRGPEWRDRDDNLPAGRPDLAVDDQRRQRRQHIRS